MGECTLISVTVCLASSAPCFAFCLSLGSEFSPSMGVFLLLGAWDLSRCPIASCCSSSHSSFPPAVLASPASSSNIWTRSLLLGPDMCCSRITRGISKQHKFNPGRSGDTVRVQTGVSMLWCRKILAPAAAPVADSRIPSS